MSATIKVCDLIKALEPFGDVVLTSLSTHGSMLSYGVESEVRFTVIANIGNLNWEARLNAEKREEQC